MANSFFSNSWSTTSKACLYNKTSFRRYSNGYYISPLTIVSPNSQKIYLSSNTKSYGSFPIRTVLLLEIVCHFGRTRFFVCKILQKRYFVDFRNANKRTHSRNRRHYDPRTWSCRVPSRRRRVSPFSSHLLTFGILFLPLY